MFKKLVLTITLAVFLACSFSAKAEAVILPFEDLIDTWNVFGFSLNSAPIIEGFLPLAYTHDINDQVDLGGGDQVLTANLELDFTHDYTDVVISRKCFGILFDGREFVRYGIRGDNDLVYDLTGSLGEVDNGQYDLVMNVDWLNDDGKLGVKLTASNFGPNPALAWLDHSRLYGTYEHVEPIQPTTQTVTPEPASLLLTSLGLAGFGLRRRGLKKS